MKLNGIFVALITPYHEDLSIDWDSFERMVEWLCQQGVEGIVPCGTTGEFLALTHHEQKEIVGRTVKVAQGRVHVMAGASGINLSETQNFLEQAYSQGAQSALVVTPYYIKSSQKGLYDYYYRLSLESPLPLIVYNNPSRTGVSLDIETLVELSALENLVGLKESSSDLSRPLSLKAKIKKEWALLSGNDDTFLPFLAAGGTGIISVGAGIVPHLYKTLWNAFQKGDIQGAQQRALSLVPWHEALGQAVNPLPIKYALSLFHGFHPTFRLPLGSLSKESQKAISICVDSLSRP